MYGTILTHYSCQILQLFQYEEHVHGMGGDRLCT